MAHPFLRQSAARIRIPYQQTVDWIGSRHEKVIQEVTGHPLEAAPAASGRYAGAWPGHRRRRAGPASAELGVRAAQRDAHPRSLRPSQLRSSLSRPRRPSARHRRSGHRLLCPVSDDPPLLEHDLATWPATIPCRRAGRLDKIAMGSNHPGSRTARARNNHSPRSRSKRKHSAPATRRPRLRRSGCPGSTTRRSSATATPPPRRAPSVLRRPLLAMDGPAIIRACLEIDGSAAARA